MKDIEISLGVPSLRQNEPAKGSVIVGYPGRYDGIVINVQILGSNGLFEYTECNGKPAENSVTRLFVPKEEMPKGRADFAGVILFLPKEPYEVKFRASIIEQHKEVASHAVFAQYLP